MPDLIVDHPWRPPTATGSSFLRARAPYADRLCEYMSCQRPRSEHRDAVSRKPETTEAGGR